jgi:hypothetical protein
VAPWPNAQRLLRSDVQKVRGTSGQTSSSTGQAVFSALAVLHSSSGAWWLYAMHLLVTVHPGAEGALAVPAEGVGQGGKQMFTGPPWG